MDYFDRPRVARRWVECGLLASALLLGAACKSIIGIEDHSFAPGDASVPPSDAVNAACEGYCDDVLVSCAEAPFQAYVENSREDCLGLCTHLPLGESANATSGNSIRCRAGYAARARGAERDADYCPAAAPGGAGPQGGASCGTNCDAYCSLYQEICTSDIDPKCKQHCEGVPDDGTFSASEDFGQPSDTIQCRLAHLTVAARYRYEADQMSDGPQREAALGSRDDHCSHSKLRPTLTNDGMPCDLPPDKAPNCADYCKLIKAACPSPLQYDNDQQCEATCKAFRVGDLMPVGKYDSSMDTLSCRRWHAYYSFDDPMTHCPHAGPSGNGHCGTPCQSYCSLLKAGCRRRYESTFMSDDMCVQQCTALRGSQPEGGYNVKGEEVQTNSFQCRLHNLTSVLTNMGAGTGMGMMACEEGIFPSDPSCP